jgi:uncharacterized protein YcfJ
MVVDRYKLRLAGAAGAALLAAGCASQPMGPTVQVLPGQNKPFEAFQADQTLCRQYADQQVAGQADAANQKGLGEAVIATALGAGLGAAIGGGHGAGVGAAAGGLLGADVGADSSSHQQHSIQEQYNNAYSQCMYSKGNQIVDNRPRPVYVTPAAPVYYYAPAPVYAAPPPPPTVYAQPAPPPPVYSPPPPPMQ